MFITINRFNNQESTINVNEIVEFRVFETSKDDKYVSIFTTNNTCVDITFEQYQAIKRMIEQFDVSNVVTCKVHVPKK